MPLLAGAVTFARLRARLPRNAASDPKRWLLGGLRRHAFRPLVAGGEEDRTTGFVELEDADGTGFAPGAVFHGEHALFAWRADAVRVPPAAVKAELGRWLAAFEAEHRRPPARREKADARGAIRQALRERTPPSTRVLDVSLELKQREILVWAASRKAVEEIAAALQEALGIELEGHVPAAIAAWGGVDPDGLAPTAELVGLDATTEAADDAA
jgi:DNA recombination-dependent growth factor C